MSTSTKPEPTAVARRDERAPNVSRRDRNETFREKIVAFQPTLMQVLPAYVKPERMIALTLTAATKNPDLFDCTLESVALAMLQIAQWDLEIGRTAYLVPFGKTCTAIPAWQGLTELMLRTGHVRDVKPKAVYANEHFVVTEGDAPRLIHTPIFDEKARGGIIAFYAMATLKGGERTWEVMTKGDVDAIRARARSKNSDAWNNHYVEMGKKTAIRRLAKRMPMNVQSSELRSALNTEDRLDAGELLESIRSREARLAAGDEREHPRQLMASPAEPGSYESRAEPEAQPREAVRVEGARQPINPAVARQFAEAKDPYDGKTEVERASEAAGNVRNSGGGDGGNEGRETPSSSEPASSSSLASSQQKARIAELLDNPELDILDEERVRIASIAGKKTLTAAHASEWIVKLERLLPSKSSLFDEDEPA